MENLFARGPRSLLRLPALLIARGKRTGQNAGWGRGEKASSLLSRCCSGRGAADTVSSTGWSATPLRNCSSDRTAGRRATLPGPARRASGENVGDSGPAPLITLVG